MFIIFLRYAGNIPAPSEDSAAPLVFWLINTQHNSIVIPGKLAIAGATRNPGISKASDVAPSRAHDTGFRRYDG